MATPPLSFDKEERVLCFHGPLIYEAKILKAEWWTAADKGAEDEGPHYFVHYKGWKQSWDEWVPESRILKHTEANLERQQELIRAQNKQKEEARLAALPQQLASMAGGKGAARAKGGAAMDGADDEDAATTTTTGGRKRTREMTTDKEDDWLKRPEIRIPLPDSLKVQLVDDWEYVTRAQRLVALPRTPTVAQFLDEYRAMRLAKRNGQRNANDDILDEMIAGLKLYFDKALGTLLLYRYERQQYADVRKRFPDTPMSELYGCEHLLRLFVQLPMLIAQTTMDQESVVLLKEQISGLIAYMQKSSSKVFMREYENAPPEYLHGH